MSAMLETARTRMEAWQPEDAAAVRRLATDSRVMRHISGGEPWDDERIREFLARQIRQEEQLGYCLWKLMLKETSEMVGLCGLQPLAGTDEIEVGWWLAPEHWGKGIATEAALAALAWAFEQKKLSRVVAVALPDNHASIRVMEKLGMRFEGRVLHKGFEVVKYAIDRQAAGT